MNKSLLSILVAGTLLSGEAVGLSTPDKSPFDNRIRTINYNSQDVVQLNTIAGVATRIELSPGEEYVTHNFGDSNAYAFAQNGRFLFLKPRAEEADTNLGVVTTERTYDFRLSMQDDRNDATYALRFNYPEMEREAARQERQERQERLERESVQDGFDVKRGDYNLDYVMGGDTDIAPINVWDNGEFTWFVFPPGIDLPTLYVADDEGNESLANRTGQGANKSRILIHTTSERWVLRLGDKALAVINNDYDPNRADNRTGTASPVVRRVLKGGDE